VALAATKVRKTETALAAGAPDFQFSQRPVTSPAVVRSPIYSRLPELYESCDLIVPMFRRRKFKLRLPSRTLLLGERTLVMGVLNVTPDSFSDGGFFFDPDLAVARAIEMEEVGADIIDIGGESTRPGSQGISAEEELRRILPVLEKLRRKMKIPISVDTSKSEVAETAAAAGAEILNDVTALRSGSGIAEVARRRKLPLILMHMRGEPRTMQKGPFARDVVREVLAGLRASTAIARRTGLSKSQIIIDPGIGFGKTYAQNFELLARLPELAKLGFPILVGTSRKSFIGRALEGTASASAPKSARVWGTAATVVASILQGAHIVRVHDVAEMVEVARVTDVLASHAK
jgi:dihydropteroate synthase